MQWRTSYRSDKEGDAMKDTIILYTAYLDKLKALTDEQFGRLIRIILRYQQGEEIGEIDDLTVSLAFDVIRFDIDRNNEKYANIVSRNRLNGQKGGRPKNPKNPLGYLETQTNPAKPKKADNDNDNEHDNDNDINNTVVFNKNNSKRKRFVDDDDLNNTILDFIEHRRKMRKPMTDYAVELFIKRLNKLATDKDDQINLINVAILKGWQTVYPSEEQVVTKNNDKLDAIEQFYLSGKTKKDGKFGI
jgi:hypothetical protein